MNDIKTSIENLKKLLAKIEPLPWSGSGANIPFYVDVKKPRQSLSKHDDKRPSYWHYDDACYMLSAVHEVPRLLLYIEQLEKHLVEAINMGVEAEATNKPMCEGCACAKACK